MPLGSLADRPIKAGAGEAEDTADGHAQVQDTEDSLEVIVVMLRAVPALVVPELRNRRPALGRPIRCWIGYPYYRYIDSARSVRGRPDALAVWVIEPTCRPAGLPAAKALGPCPLAAPGSR